MKKSPVRNINTPCYPTMEQLKKNTCKSPMTKIAAVTALTAVMALSATGCGEEATKHKMDGRLGVFGGMATETYEIEGEIEIGGDTTVDTTYDLSGDIQIDGGMDTYVEPTDATCTTDDDIDYQGGETVEADPSEF
ncbi:MAG: hypothetical protein J6Y58_05770 [Clostridiales bacterium]|nr:hypothetical protein [Clostridiales bacterium]